jgi:hypothetical protein
VIVIKDIIGGHPVHVVAVDGQLIAEGLPRPPATGSPDVLVGVFTCTPQDDRITIPSHGLANGDQIRFELDDPNSCVLPFPLNDADYFFVANARGNDFMVSSTQGGAVINITDKGVGSNEVWKKGTGNAPPSKVQLFYVQSGRSADLFALAAASRKFGKKDGQIWYSVGGFMNWDVYAPVDIGELTRKLEGS